MNRFHRHHSFGSALKRFLVLVDGVGVIAAAAILMAEVDDEYFRLFDRAYGISTSGYISLRATSFDPARFKDALAYRPVNAWALRRLLKVLSLPKTLRFADLGSGLGRPCIIAAEYGFQHVTGVELAPDLCARARENIWACRDKFPAWNSLEMVQADVLDYCAHSVDDVFFMYRPFSREVFEKVLQQLAENASRQKKVLTVVYSENVLQDPDYVEALSRHPAYRKLLHTRTFGFEFHVYECRSA